MLNSIADPAPMQRVSAHGLLAVRSVEGRSRLARLGQEGAAKIRMPRVDRGPLEAVLINTAGGLTGGDRLSWAIEVGTGAAASITTQACEKLYRASSGVAEVACTLTVGENARLAWLPQETIAYQDSVFARTIDVDLAPGAEALILEATVFGRLSMGERTRSGQFRDQWRVRRNGSLVHAENFAIGPDVAGTLARRASTGGQHAMATILWIAHDAVRALPDVRAIVGPQGGASAWSLDRPGSDPSRSGKLLARLIAEDSYSLRKVLVPLVELLNGQAGLPKLWSF